jgi:hypothetical protein
LKVPHQGHVGNCWLTRNIYYIIFRDVYNFHRDFHISSSNSPLVITAKLKAKWKCLYDCHIVLHSTKNTFIKFPYSFKIYYHTLFQEPMRVWTELITK